MELIVAACAILMPVFLALEVAAPHPGAGHPLKLRPAMAAANDAVEPIAA